MLKKLQRVLVYIIPLLIFSYFIFDEINLPYVGPNATNFSIYSLIAHNFNKFGYIETKLAPLISVSRDFPTKPNYFFHHPTLTSFSESIMFKIFGESFWSGRLTVILYSFGALILTYFIAKNLLDKRYAYFCLLVMSLVPTTTIFGKLIGQEPLVLFFILLILYSSIKYFKTKNKKYFYLSILAVILGALSDWPMVYFSLFLLPLYFKSKQTKQGLIIAASGFVTALLFVALTVNIMGGFQDLKNAVALRSFNGLLTTPMWPILWTQTMFLRFLIYFNPIILTLSVISLFWVFKQKKSSQINLVLLILLLFGLFHIILYAQASFTHPYLIHYLLPFVVLSSAYCLHQLKLNKIILILIFLISFIYLFFLNQSKNYQVESNLWRYELTKQTVSYLKPYETAIINGSTAIDPDVLWYPFFINSYAFDWKNPYKNLNKYQHLVFSCLNFCSENKKEIAYLKENYNYYYLTSPEAEVYVFVLDKRVIGAKTPLEAQFLKTKKTNKPFFLNAYRKLREVFKAPQI